jgi:malate dehydrogenase (oxaloacetate-decarboxylating)
MDYQQKSTEYHRKMKGKLEIVSKMPITNQDELSLAYTPGVAGPCLEIAQDKDQAYELTSSKNAVAVVSDGSSVLGLGDIGPEAALPVMEGKAALFKAYAGVDAFPIVLNTKDIDEIITAVKMIAPTFGGINLEDIGAPRCFEIERRLNEELTIPVFHDDQHGTAIVVLAGIINALKVVGKEIETAQIVINGAGAAGSAIAKLLHSYGALNITMCDKDGILSSSLEGLDDAKKALLSFTNKEDVSGSVHDAIKNADVFIGVSRGDILTAEDVETMASDAIVFAMANPTPEIMPDEAKKGGARIVATGRSDFPNQLNNVLVFPGIFKGAIQTRACAVTNAMKIDAAKALAALVDEPTEDEIIPSPFHPGVADAIASAVKNTRDKGCTCEIE